MSDLFGSLANSEMGRNVLSNILVNNTDSHWLDELVWLSKHIQQMKPIVIPRISPMVRLELRRIMTRYNQNNSDITFHMFVLIACVSEYFHNRGLKTNRLFEMIPNIFHLACSQRFENSEKNISI